MVLDTGSVQRHLDLLRSYVSDLLRYRKSVDPQALRTDRDLQYQVLFPLTMGIQSSIDLANHVVAALGLRRPETYAEVFEVLAQAKVLDGALARRLALAARARNLFIHHYWQIDIERVWQMVEVDVDDLVELEKTIAAWLAGQ